jgi:hypothetical protein
MNSKKLNNDDIVYNLIKDPDGTLNWREDFIDQYKNARKAVFEYFNYVENWRILPIDDARSYFWKLVDEESEVRFADTEEQLEEYYYVNEVYRQRCLKKWVYRGPEYTMIVVDTRADGNQLLQIFSNNKERT